MPRQHIAEKVHLITGVASATDINLVTAEPPDRRQWVIIQCDLATGVPAIVQWGEGPTSATWGATLLEPGESIVFSRWGDMPWLGPIYVSGSSGICGYRGGEVYHEER